MANLEEMDKLLSELNQTHLLQYFNKLSDEEKVQFLRHLQSLDLELAVRLFEKSKTVLNGVVPDITAIKPIPPSQFESAANCEPEILETYRKIGLEAIGNGEVGVLLLAGGQGTRLGVAYPKGMFSVGLPSEKTFFQILAERIKRLEYLAKLQTKKTGKITWYIMTSETTHEKTTDFLVQHNYFGLQPEDVVRFKQGLLPCFDFEGRIILEKEDRVALAPDGNGGIYRALAKHEILKHMNGRGIKYLHAHSVDNILTKVADPIFIGYCVKKGSDCGAKVVKKSSPDDAVGVVCQLNAHFQVVEYSEITPDIANLRDEKGELVYSAGSICNHFFTTEFLEKILTHENDLKLHIAKKKIPSVGDTGTTNGLKIEKFIFDVFPFAENFVTWEVPRHSEFSAMKNQDGVHKDCPSTAKQDLLDLHRSYIEKAGGVVNGDVEISPLLSYAGEGLESHVAGKVFNDRTVLYSEEEICKNRICTLN